MDVLLIYLSDFFHICAVIYLITKIIKTRSCKGISGKSQVLLTIVQITNIMSMSPYNIYNAYNGFLESSFTCMNFVTLLLIFVIFCETYQYSEDTFSLVRLLPFPLFSALLVNYCFGYSFDPLSILWTFSKYLEIVAMCPQFVVIYRTKQIRKTVLIYLLLLMFYKVFYTIRWSFFENQSENMIQIICGSFYLLMFIVFWYQCISHKIKIVNEDVSFFAQNLNTINGNGNIFIINVSLPEKPLKNDRVPLIEENNQTKMTDT